MTYHFVKHIGIAGVLLATVISLYTTDWLTKPFVIYKQIFMKNPCEYYIKYMINTLFIIIVTTSLYILIPKSYSNIFSCLLVGVVITIINSLITIVYYYLTKQLTFISRFSYSRKGGNGNEN